MCSSELTTELAFRITSEQTVHLAKGNGKELAVLDVVPTYLLPTKNSSSENVCSEASELHIKVTSSKSVKLTENFHNPGVGFI